MNKKAKLLKEKFAHDFERNRESMLSLDENISENVFRSSLPHEKMHSLSCSL